MPIRTPLGLLKQALRWHRVVMQAQDLPVPDTMPIRIGGRMPAKSKAQQKFMGAELARKRAGKETETDMSAKQLEEFAATKTKKLPEKVKAKGKKSSRASY